MDKLNAVSLAGCLLLLGGCAGEDAETPVQDVANHFQRGLSGEGQIGPIDRGSDDPYVRSRESAPLRP